MPLGLYAEDSDTSSTIKVTLAIAAGKGGVGKSTVAVNLALGLQELGFTVGILDSDIYGPSVYKMLPAESLPRQEGDVLVPARCFGIRVISMAYFLHERQAVGVRAPIANSIICQFLETVAWGELDYLIIDLPPGTGDIPMTVSQKGNISAAIMVTTPQEIALLDVRRAIALFKQMHVPILGIVENMSYYDPFPGSPRCFPFGSGGGQLLADEAAVSLLASIPLDPVISERGDRGFSLFVDDGSGVSPAVEAFRHLTASVVTAFTHQPIQTLCSEKESCL